VLLDITATHEGRQTLLDTVRRTRVSYSFPSALAAAFVPLMMRRRSSKQARTRSASTPPPRRPTLIDAIGRSFGAQAVVVAIDARRDPQAADPVRDAQVFVQGGRRPQAVASSMGA